MLPWWITLIAVVATVVGSFAAVLWLLGTMAARHINKQIEEPQLALFIVGVDDPTDPVRRYYGPFVTNLDAEEYAAPLRLDGVHAWVAPLWRP